MSKKRTGIYKLNPMPSDYIGTDKRLPDESFKDYKARLKRDKKLLNQRLKPTFLIK